MIMRAKKKFWDPIMDPNTNPLMQLPPMVRYQIMTVLAMMWSFIFCAMMAWWQWFPYWIVGHILLLSLGAYVTNRTFDYATKLSHRDRYRSADKRHALHDDIWGA
jgi:hypothetical protein